MRRDIGEGRLLDGDRIDRDCVTQRVAIKRGLDHRLRADAAERAVEEAGVAVDRRVRDVLVVEHADDIVEHAGDAIVGAQAQFVRGFPARDRGELEIFDARQDVGGVLRRPRGRPAIAVGTDVVELLAGEAPFELTGDEIRRAAALGRTVGDGEAVLRRDDRAVGAVARAEDVGERLRARPQALVHDRGIERRAGLEAQRRAHGLRARIGLGAEVGARHARTVVVIDQRGDAQGQDVGDERQADRRLEVDVAAVGAAEVHIAADFIEIRAMRGDGDRAGRRGAAAERALRALEHFDLADVEQRLADRRAATGGRVIQVELDDRAGVRVEEGRHAAHRRARAEATSGRGAALDRDARDDLGDVGGVVDAQLLDGVARNGVHHLRHVLQALVLAARGDDDRAGVIGLEGGVGRVLREDRRCRGDRCHAGKKNCLLNPHSQLPGEMAASGGVWVDRVVIRQSARCRGGW